MMNTRFMQVAPHIALGVVFTKAGYDILTTSRYMKSMTHQTEGVETQLDGKTSTLIEKVMEKLKLDPSVKDKYMFFVTSENDPITKGNSRWRTGAAIGLPYHFRLQSRDDVEKTPLLVKGQLVQVDWSSEEGTKLADSLVLSDKAKSFVIARDVNMLRLFFSHTEVFLQAAFIIFGFTMMSMFDKYLLSMKKLPSWSRHTALALVGASTFVVYMAAADTYSCSKDMRADRVTAECSREYAEGGVEYYVKVISRNQAFRALMPEKLSNVYTAEGDSVRYLRTHHLPFTARLAYLKTYLANYEQQEKHH